MGVPVVRLGAWCDIDTEDEARQRLLTTATDHDDGQEEVDGHAGPRPGRYVPLREVPARPRGQLSFRVEEFAVLADGRRIRLHAERGWTQSAVRGLPPGVEVDPWQGLTLENLEPNVRNTVLPDDAEDTGDEHPWEWLCGLLLAQGIEASPEQLRTVPYDVEYSDRLRARVLTGA